MQSLKQVINNWYLYLVSTAFCLLPGCTVIALLYAMRRRSMVYELMCEAVANDDLVYKKLTVMGFTYDEHSKSFKCIKARGQVAPNVIDRDTVELDSSIWVAEHLQQLRSNLAAYGLEGQLQHSTSYDKATDSVLVVLEPVATEVVYNAKYMLPINAVITMLAVCVVLLLILK